MKTDMNEDFMIDVLYMRKYQKRYMAKGTQGYYTEMQKYQQKVDKHIEKFLKQQSLPF